MKFYLDNTKPCFDFQLELLHAKKWYEWYNECKDKNAKTNITITYRKPLLLFNYCPVGTVEFTNEYLKEIGVNLVPINVPKVLFPFAARRVENYIFSDKNVFVKSNKKIKDSINGYYKEVPLCLYKESIQVSEYINDIVSEWRVFVYNGKMLDIKNYLGDPFVTPSKAFIYEVIDKYKDQPICYTLDIFVRQGGINGIMEVHDFMSCGLYGFSDYKLFPYMLWRTYKQILEKNK